VKTIIRILRMTDATRIERLEREAAATLPPEWVEEMERQIDYYYSK